MLCSNFAAVIVMTCMALLNFNVQPKSESCASPPEVQTEAEPVDLIAGNFHDLIGKQS